MSKTPVGFQESRPENWAEVWDLLFANAWNPTLDRFRCQEAFRGLSDVEYSLTTALIRLGGDFVPLERNLLRNFRKYAHQQLNVGDSIWNWLAVGQHHGLATRLLDWSFSPLVALHFATSNVRHFDRDGVVWCVDYVRTHDLLPAGFRQLLAAEGSNIYTVKMLEDGAKTLEDFDAMGTDRFAVFFEPPSLDGRIVNQSALFSVMSSPKIVMSDWLRDRPALVRRVVIPAALKWEVRDKLDEQNVTERVLFPGLDGLSEWLTRYYGPRGSGLVRD